MVEDTVRNFLRKRRRRGQRSFGSADKNSDNKMRHSTLSLRSLPLAVDWCPSESMTTPDRNHKQDTHSSITDNIDPDIPRTVEMKIQTKRTGFTFDEEAEDDDDDLLAPNFRKEKDDIKDDIKDDDANKVHSKEMNENKNEEKVHSKSKTIVQETPNNKTKTMQKSMDQIVQHKEDSTKATKLSSEKGRLESTQKAQRKTTKYSSTKKDPEKQTDKTTPPENRQRTKSSEKDESLPSKKVNLSEKEQSECPLGTRERNVKELMVVETSERPFVKKVHGRSGATGDGLGGSATKKRSKTPTSQRNKRAVSLRRAPEQQQWKTPDGTENAPVRSQNTRSETRDETMHASEKVEEKIEGGWTCTTCTLYNNEKARRCDACRNRRPVTINIENENILSQRSCNTAKSTPVSGAEVSEPNSKSRKTSVVPSTSPDSSIKSSNRKRRQPSPSARRNLSKSSSRKKSKLTPERAGLPKSYVPQSTEKPTALENQMDSNTARTLLSPEHDHKELERGELTCPENSAQVEPIFAGDSSVPYTLKTIETNPRQPMSSSEKDSSIRKSNDPAIEENNKDSKSKTEEIETISTLRAENELLRQKVKKLEKELIQFWEDRNRKSVRSTQVSRIVAERLLDEFTAQTIASLGRTKEDFLKSYFGDRLKNDDTCKTSSLGLVADTGGFKISEKLSVGDTMLGTVPVTCFRSHHPSTSPGIMEQVSLIEQTKSVAHPTNNTGLTDHLPHILSPAKTTDFQQKSSEETVDPKSPVLKGHCSANREDNQTSGRNNAPSQNQKTVETSPYGPTSPANSTQTTDPTEHKKPLDFSISEQSSPSLISRGKRCTFNRSIPSVAGTLEKEINGASLQAGPFGPLSPANSMQTIHQMAFNSNRNMPRSTFVESCPDNLGSQSSRGLTVTANPSRLVSRRDGSNPRTTPTVDSTSKSDLENTLQVSRYCRPTSVSKSNLPTGVFDSNQTKESRPTNSPASTSKETYPPHRKDNLLGNSTNKKSSATWTSNVTRMSFLEHLNNSSGTTATSKENGSASVVDANRWVTSNRPTRLSKKPPAESSTIWDDSQDFNPNHKYKEVVRCRSKRQGLPCHDCADCQAFYECMRRSGHEFSQDVGLMEHSRHRARFAPSETPVDFWEFDFLDEKRKTGKIVATGESGDPDK